MRNRSNFGFPLNNVCEKCDSTKSVYSGLCHKCHLRTDRVKFLKKVYQALKSRCTGGNPETKIYKLYHGLSYCTKDEFLNKFKNCDQFNLLYKNWQESDFDKRLTPSIDRINSKKGYDIDNLQFLPLHENCKKDIKRPINCYKDGKYICEFESIKEASEKLGVNKTNISRVLRGKGKTAGGYIFKYIIYVDDREKGYMKEVK